MGSEPEVTLITNPNRLLAAGRPIAGLLCAPRLARDPAQVRRLVHELWTELRTVRQTKSPEALYKSMQLLRQLNESGFAVVIINQGRVVGAEDDRFRGKELASLDEVAKSAVVTPRPETQTEKFFRLRAALLQLPEAEREALLRSIRREHYLTKEKK